MESIEFKLTPAQGAGFVGRKEIIGEIVKELGNTRNNTGFCVYGRRRIGKTSILMQAKKELGKNKGVVVAYLSLYDVADLTAQTLTQELLTAIMKAYQEKKLLPIETKIRNLLKAPAETAVELLKNAKIQATVLDQVKILLEFREKNDKNYSEHIRNVFNTGEVLANATGTKFVLMLDEFPEILKVENGLQLVKILRTQCEKQKKTALVISGSLRKTLQAVALSEGSPFYKQLVPKHVPPFSMEETKDFLERYAGKTGDVKILYALTGGNPFYLQYIGRSTKYALSVQDAVDKFIEQEGSVFFKEEFEKLTDKEKLIAETLSKGKKSLTQMAKETNMPTTTVGRYLPTLIEEEIIEKESRGSYALQDNLYAYWLKQKQAN